MLIHFECPANYVGIRAEVRSPETVADDGYGSATGFQVFFGQKAAAEGGADAEEIKIVGGDDCSPRALGLAFAGEAHGSDSGADKAAEALLAIAHGVEIRIGERERSVGAAAERECDYFVGTGEAGDRIQQRGIDPGEDGGVRADAESESEDGDRGVARRLGDHSQAVAHVLPE